MDKLAKVRTINLEKYRRVIAVSDLHGDYDGFCELLDKVKFTENDALIIVGDILEKGQQSLQLLCKVTEMAEQGNVFLVLGNNDTVLLDWETDEWSYEDVLNYAKRAWGTVIRNMAESLGVSLNTTEDLQELEQLAERQYKEQIDFLKESPYILDTDLAVFVHAGLDPAKTLYKQDVEYCRRTTEYIQKIEETGFYFEKPLVVGHWPSSNYSDVIINVNSYYSEKANVYSIDGGNSMKRWQQINYLVFEDGNVHMEYLDRLKKIRVLEDQNIPDEEQKPMTLIFPNTMVEIRERGEHDSLCYVPYLDRSISVANSRLYHYKGHDYCYDVTEYLLPVKANEIIFYCNEQMPDSDGIEVKRDGIVGMYRGAWEFVKDTE